MNWKIKKIYDDDEKIKNRYSVGDKVRWLTILEIIPHHISKKYVSYWAKCKCGNKIKIEHNRIKGGAGSCGCAKRKALSGIVNMRDYYDDI